MQDSCVAHNTTETDVCVLFGCPFALECWRFIGVDLSVSPDISSFSDVLNPLLWSKERDILKNICVTCWCI